MSSSKARSSIDEKRAGQDEFVDLEATVGKDGGPLFIRPLATPSRSLFSTLEDSFLVQVIFCYPASGSLKIRSTAWLDGVRGVTALGVYIFHAFGCWAPIVPAWHADENQTNLLQLPLVRTIFVSGGTAVSLFFALSGYVLTHKSLRWMRTGSKHLVYPAVASSMFRRGFRLYLPPVFLTFCEMISTRFGFVPPLNFNFVPELTFSGQLADWVVETHQLINPVYFASRALRGFVTHPKYDSVVWTIPLEYLGSFLCYILLLLLVYIPSNAARMVIIAVVAVVCMAWGSWNMFCFSAGMLIADFNLGQDDNDDHDATTVPSSSSSSSSSPRRRRVWTAVFAVAFYVAGFPTLGVGDAKTNPMPGFETLRSLIPMNLAMEDPARFPWSISGIALLLSISQLPGLKAVFESKFCQYLGKISFSMYLIHTFCIVLFGARAQRLLLDIAGLQANANTLLYWIICAIWYFMFTIAVFALAAQVERWVDVPSVRFARWLEGKCLKIYRRQ